MDGVPVGRRGAESVRRVGRVLVTEVPMKGAIAVLRAQLPASMAVCRQALEASGGDLQQAHAWVVRQLVDEYRHRTGVDAAEAAIDLQAAGHDVERAIVLWRRRNPLPPLRPFAALEKGGALAAELASVDTGLRCFAHVIPGAQGTYELRLITHAARFTETTHGFDYDYAMQDAQTRVERRFVTGVPALTLLLQEYAIDEAMLCGIDAFDSCLLHSPIEAYL
ncbi:MAG: hypothetical protein RR831_09660 [Stenotrophomonas sp.]